MQEHPFAEFLRILGKGRHGQRDLDRDEAERAMRMILAGQVDPAQLGAFLMLLRVKGESVDELTGMLLAARAALPASTLSFDLDWPAYAGKRKHLPWYLLAARLLAQQGIRILLHTAPVEERLQVRDLVDTLQLPWAAHWEDLAAQVDAHSWACIDLSAIQPRLAQMLQLRHLLGVRSPMHSLVRLLNPGRAPAMLVPIFHPAYRDTHRAVLHALQQSSALVFKGEGGEAERNPDALLRISATRAGHLWDAEWPALFEQRHGSEEPLDPQHLQALWRGDSHDEYGVAAVCGTVAIALLSLGRAEDEATAYTLAQRYWRERQIY